MGGIAVSEGIVGTAPALFLGMGRAHRGELVIGVEDDSDPVHLPTDDDGSGTDPGVRAGELFQAFHGENEFQPFHIVETEKELYFNLGRHRKGVGGLEEGTASADVSRNRINYRQLIFAVAVGYSRLEVEGKSFLDTFVAGHCCFLGAKGDDETLVTRSILTECKE